MYSNMYLKGPRLAFFALTTALSIATVGLAGWGLKVLNDKKDLVKDSFPGATLHATPILAVGAALTAASGIAALACTILFALMLFRPRHDETKSSVMFKEALLAAAFLTELAVMIATTVVAATKTASVTAPGVPQALINALVAASGQKLPYKYTHAVVAYTITGWLMTLSTLISLICVSLAARHVLANGHPEHHAGASTIGTENGSNIEKQST